MTTTHPADSYGAEVVDPSPGSLDALVADGVDVAKQLDGMAARHDITIPARAVALVSGLDSYGD